MPPKSASSARWPQRSTNSSTNAAAPVPSTPAHSGTAPCDSSETAIAEPITSWMSLRGLCGVWWGVGEAWCGATSGGGGRWGRGLCVPGSGWLQGAGRSARRAAAGQPGVQQRRRLPPGLRPRRQPLARAPADDGHLCHHPQQVARQRRVARPAARAAGRACWAGARSGAAQGAGGWRAHAAARARRPAPAPSPPAVLRQVLPGHHSQLGRLHLHYVPHADAQQHEPEQRVAGGSAQLQVALQVAGVHIRYRHQQPRPGEPQERPPREPEGSRLVQHQQRRLAVLRHRDGAERSRRSAHGELAGAEWQEMSARPGPKQALWRFSQWAAGFFRLH
jgi:hypothetical protein